MNQLISFLESLMIYFLCLLWTNLFLFEKVYCDILFVFYETTYFIFRKSTVLFCLSSMNQLISNFRKSTAILSLFYEATYFLFRKVYCVIFFVFYETTYFLFRKSTALFSLSSMNQLISFLESLLRYFLCLLWTNLFLFWKVYTAIF